MPFQNTQQRRRLVSVASDAPEETYEEKPRVISDIFDKKHKFIGDVSLEVDTTDLQASTQRLDVQRIGWEINIKRSRSNYRFERMKGYDRYSEKNLDESKPVGELCDLERKLLFPRDEKCCFYSFRANSRQTPCSFTHFQLRHLLAATSPTDVYYMNDFGVHHWNSIAQTTSQSEGKRSLHRTVMDLRVGAGIVKDISYMGESAQSLPGILSSTVNASGSYLVTGGFKGEIVIMDLETEGILYNGRYVL